VKFILSQPGWHAGAQGNVELLLDAAEESNTASLHVLQSCGVRASAAMRRLEDRCLAKCGAFSLECVHQRAKSFLITSEKYE